MTHFFAGTSGQAAPVRGLLTVVMALNDGVEIRLYRADQKWKSGRWQAAWNEMARHPAIECDRVEATKLWMHICVALKRWALGERFARLLVEQAPDKDMHWLYYGVCAWNHRGYQGKYEVYREAVALYPSDGSYHYRLATSLCGLGRIDEGRDALALALALDAEYLEYAMDQPVFSEIWEDFAEVEG